MKYEILIHGGRSEDARKRIVEFDLSNISALIDGRNVNVDVAPVSSSMYSVLLDGRSMEVTIEKAGDEWLLHTAGHEFHVEIVNPRSLRKGRSGDRELEGRQQITAPMPGKVIRVLATQGQKVEAGQGLLVIEAMKMQNEIRSPKSGTVERISREGQTVNAGEILAVVI